MGTTSTGELIDDDDKPGDSGSHRSRYQRFERRPIEPGLGRDSLSHTPTASADDWCPDVELVFARGTGEPPGMGRVGDALAARLQPQLGGRTLGT
jgi:hypothetical protein